MNFLSEDARCRPGIDFASRTILRLGVALLGLRITEVARGRIVIATANREIKQGLNRRATDTPPGRYVALSVADNGTGMDESTSQRIFEPFLDRKSVV